MFRKSTYYIYTLTNTENEVVMYVGSTNCIAQRQRSHKYANNTAIYKYAKENNINYRFDVVEEVWANSKDDVRTSEAFWIRFMQSKGHAFLNKNLVNVSFSFKENKIIES